MKTIESLGVYWAFIDESSGEIYQDEVGGLVFYGYWRERGFSEIVGNESSFEAVWEGSADVKFRKWEGEGMSNLSAEVKINMWPDELKWLSYVERSLRWFVEHGATVSWCGSELCSPSLDVFSSGEGSGSVYAAYSEDLGFVRGSGLEEEYQDINASQLDEFNKIVLG
ncbi:hypothetical protein [Pseudomonas sp. 273]|uniref:hypothetical protein n=1 Tax=Pseudomonas sp. 273 TaxID=75692 RepID=UPI0023D87E9C|nr:hypothetical protein [Pseudomonas sp. 273]